MTIRLRKDPAILIGARTPCLDAWLEMHDGQVFKLKAVQGDAYFHALRKQRPAPREPINITFKAPGLWRLISNIAATEFVLDGLSYASVEAFWQGLKFPDETKRREIASFFGSQAKDAGFRAPASNAIVYFGRPIGLGTWEHWQLMERACMAKFEQNDDARLALMSTGKRPLVHQMKLDSRAPSRL
jgi:predicted NAD-dependent protein-ADP-ribosyltransferase YbiA (DUF1768 family)